MTLAMAEILEKVSKMKKKDDKIKFLREHDTVAFRTVLCYALHPGVKSALPPGAPPYTPSELADENVGMLYSQYSKLYMFCVGGADNLNPIKREHLFIQFLESVHPKDAELILAAKEKKLHVNGVSKELLAEAYPGIFD